MRSEFSDNRAVVTAEAIVAAVEKDLIDVVALDGFEIVRDIKLEGLVVDIGLSHFFDFSFTHVGVNENKRVQKQAQLGNLGVRQREIVGVVKRCLKFFYI